MKIHTMKTKSKDLYEAPTVEVVEVKMDNGILATSDYHKNDYWEE